jgi:hypothetical protein
VRQVQHERGDPDGWLRDVFELRVFEVRVSDVRIESVRG